jgi:hypothetical protein
MLRNFKNRPRLERRVSGGQAPQTKEVPMLFRDHPLMMYKVTAAGRQPGCGQRATTLPTQWARLESLKLYCAPISNPMTDAF